MKRIPYSYCIFYIERKYYQNINKELKERDIKSTCHYPYDKRFKENRKG